MRLPHLSVAVLSIAALFTLSSCTEVPAGTGGSAESGSALEALDTVPIKGRAPKTGYDRAKFGAAWTDVDKNGCDTRNDILARDLTTVVYKRGTRDCVVSSGTLADPYGGKSIRFVRGNDTSSLVQIDHVVALSDAWQKGAQQWTTEKRTAFANDPLNLMAADGPLNQQKSDSDAASWLPPNKAFRCHYVARQVAVKSQYGLWVTKTEREAMRNVLTGCPDQELPTVATTTRYSSCAQVRASGKGPVRRGDPGYSADLDRDGDGVACDT